MYLKVEREIKSQVVGVCTGLTYESGVEGHLQGGQGQGEHLYAHPAQDPTGAGDLLALLAT